MGARAPARLIRRLTAEEADQVNRWWRAITPTERRTLRHDAGRPPVGVMARFVEDGEATDADDEPGGFYEYLVNHEIYLEDGRRVHICSAHPLARALIARGRFPADFVCPRSYVACPIRALVAEGSGRDARLSLVWVCDAEEGRTRG